MLIEVDNERTYVPQWNNNREADDPIKISHRFLKAGERKKYIYTEPLKLSVETGTVGSDVNYVQDGHGISKALITKIENLEIKDRKSGKVTKIENVNTLYNTSGVPHGLISEIEMYMLVASPEVDADFL